MRYTNSESLLVTSNDLLLATSRLIRYSLPGLVTRYPDLLLDPVTSRAASILLFDARYVCEYTWLV